MISSQKSDERWVMVYLLLKHNYCTIFRQVKKYLVNFLSTRDPTMHCDYIEWKKE